MRSQCCILGTTEAPNKADVNDVGISSLVAGHGNVGFVTNAAEFAAGCTGEARGR